jgi:hypothetical protein
MTSQSPRIYTYKITFEEVPYYYYGVHKEVIFNEYYMGTPITHKWYWDFYTPQKQILQLFDFTDDGWLGAQEVEMRLIKSFYDVDKWCLNESCGGKVSLEIRRQNGQKAYELGLGIHNYTEEERRKLGRKNGQKTYELGLGVHGRTKEQMSNDGKIGGKLGGKIGGNRLKELGLGIFALTKEEKSEISKNTYKNGKGLASITKEQRERTLAKINSQKWKCLETGHISTSGALSNYQKARGIDTSKRKRIE